MSLRLPLARLFARLPGPFKCRLLAKVGDRLLRPLAADDPWRATLKTNLGEGFDAPLKFPAGYAARGHWFDHWHHYAGEHGALRLFDALAPDSAGLLDVGAHLGVYTLVLARRHRHWQVHAFEPTPILAEALAANIEAAGLAGRAQVHRMAVCEADGECTFHVVAGDGMLSSLIDHGGGVPLKVPAIRLDSFVAQHGLEPSRWLLKVDVETAEPLVVAGAPALLAATPAVVMEMLEPARRSGLIDAVAQRFGFDVYYIAGHELRAKRGDDGDDVRGEYNWLFTRYPRAQLATRVRGHGLRVVG